MLKRVLHAANQVVTHEETHTGKELTIENTVNAPAEVRVRGDSWQGSTTGAQLLDYIEKYKGTSYATVVDNNAVLIPGINRSDTKLIIEYGEIQAGTYTISADCYGDARDIRLEVYIDGTKKADTGNKIGNAKTTFTIDAGILSVKIHTGDANGSIVTVGGFCNLMLNAGSTALPWEPYTGNAPSPSPEYPQDIISVSGILKSTNNSLGGRDKLRESQITIPELRAIPGTDVRDELVVYEDGSGKIVRRVANRHLSPDDNFGNSGLSTDETKNFLMKSIVDLKPQKKGYITNASCNIANTGKVQGFNVANTVFAGGSNSDILYICVSSEVASTVEEFKTLVASKDIYVNYEIEPIEEPLTAAEVQGFLRTHQYHTEIGFEGLDEHLEPEVEVKCEVLGR